MLLLNLWISDFWVYLPSAICLPLFSAAAASAAAAAAGAVAVVRSASGSRSSGGGNNKYLDINSILSVYSDIVVGPRLVFRRGKNEHVGHLDVLRNLGVPCSCTLARCYDWVLWCGVGTGNVIALAHTFDATSCVLYAQLSYSISAGSCLTVSEFSGQVLCDRISAGWVFSVVAVSRLWVSAPLLGRVCFWSFWRSDPW